jgi:hypothetical protein
MSHKLFPLNSGESRLELRGRGLVGSGRRAIGPVNYQLAVTYSARPLATLAGEIQFEQPGLDLPGIGPYRLQLADGVGHLSVLVVSRERAADDPLIVYGVRAAHEQAGKHNVLLHRPTSPKS